MPYKLDGNCVVKADTGAVVKCHGSRRKALAHLAALRINVKEAETSYKRKKLARRILERLQEATKGDVSAYGMVALFLPDGIAKQLSVSGGESPKDLHITLMFLGDIETIKNPDMVRAVVADIARFCKPLNGQINGIGRFIQTHKPGYHAIYVSPDLKDLPKLYEQLANGLETTEIGRPSEHGFVPHITLSYVPENDTTPNVLPAIIPVTFDTISVVMGDQRSDYKLEGR